jgi:hypothetical protein
VMFHPEIPYADALRRGNVQAEILAELDRAAVAGTVMEPDAIRSMIETRLPAL